MTIIVVSRKSEGSQVGYKFFFLLFIGSCLGAYEKKIDGDLLHLYQKIGAEVANETCRTEDQSYPFLCALSNQQTTAVWQSVGGIYGQIFNKDGINFGNDFLTFSAFPSRNIICLKAYNFISDILGFIDKKISRMLQVLPGAKAADVGQIAQFAGNCPDGWGDYIQGQERFIFGAGGEHNVGDLVASLRMFSVLMRCLIIHIYWIATGLQD